MNALTGITTRGSGASSLSAMVSRAATLLAEAKTCAEVLDARDMASVAYDAAKKAARMAQAKGAHDELIARARDAQRSALEIEAEAKRRLADEYDAAQERGEVRSDRQRTASEPEAVGATDLGLTHKQVHEARQIRDAEIAQPGIVKRTLNRAIDEGREPTRTELQRSVMAAVALAKSRPQRSHANPDRRPDAWYDRVIRFRSLCEQIAAYGDQISEVAAYRDLPLVRERVHREAANALETLRKFEEVSHA